MSETTVSAGWPLAVSCLAWTADDDDHALGDLARAGISGVEVAPTRLWGDWADITVTIAERYRADLEAVGLSCPALQALLFGRPHWQLLHENRLTAAEHLCDVARLAQTLDAGILVLGSPRNRMKRELTTSQAQTQLRETLLPAAELLAADGRAFGLEANPREYGSDWLFTYEEVLDTVAVCDHPGIVAHYDIGGALLCAEQSVVAAPAYVHFSQPQLAAWENTPASDTLLLSLRAQEYSGWVSIEQTPTEAGWPAVLEAVQEAQTAIAKACL